jgi:tetratricopeptide (TPR) repeat protein
VESTQSNIFDYLNKLKFGKYFVYLLEGTGIVVTLYEFQGVFVKGLRFLGRFSKSPGVLWGLLIGVSIAVCTTSILIIFPPKKKQQRQKKNKENKFGKPSQIIAGILLITNISATIFVFSRILRYDIVKASEANKVSIMIATFGQGTFIDSSPYGREASAYIARSLRREIDLSGYEITILNGPHIISAEDAFSEGSKKGANVVLWGWVSDTNPEIIVPNFTFIETKCDKDNLGKLPVLQSLELDAGSTTKNSNLVSRRAISFIEYIIGLLHIENEKVSEAIEAFDSVISKTEEDLVTASVEDRQLYKDALAYYHTALGRTHALNQDNISAKKEYDLAIEYSPNFWPIYIGLGNIHYDDNLCGAAFNSYSIAANLNPDGSSVWYALGNAKYCDQEYKAAAHYYKIAIEKISNCDKYEGLYRLVLGASLCRTGETVEGEYVLSEALLFLIDNEQLTNAVNVELDKCKDHVDAQINIE